MFRFCLEFVKSLFMERKYTIKQLMKWHKDDKNRYSHCNPYIYVNVNKKYCILQKLPGL